jgi:tetratricopeptide (TPR) repeat protein
LNDIHAPDQPSSTDSAALGQDVSLLAQGRAHYARAQYQEALSCLHLAYDERLAQEQASRDQEGQAAEIANDLGVVYTVLERWQEAEKWLGEAQQRFVRARDLGGEAQTLGNMGSMYRVRGDLKQAAAYLQLSADRFHVVGDDEHRAASLRALSLVRLRQLRPMQAVAAYSAALACRPEPNLAVRLLIKLLDLPFRLRIK